MLGYTYKCDYKIKHRPKAAEVFVETHGNPLEHHLNDKNDTKYEIGPIQYFLQ